MINQENIISTSITHNVLTDVAKKTRKTRLSVKFNNPWEILITTFRIQIKIPLIDFIPIIKSKFLNNE